MGAVRSLHESPAPLNLADVDLVHRRTPDDELPFRCAGSLMPAYIEIIREGLGSRPGDAETVLTGIADLLDALSSPETPVSEAALYALARFQRHALAIQSYSKESADGWTVEPRKAGA